MFKKLMKLWRKDDLFKQAMQDFHKMFSLCKKLYGYAVSPLLKGGEDLGQTIYDLDKEINKFEIGIRKKILEHLAISQGRDVTAALVLTTLVIDVERIGDYAKNFHELKYLYGDEITRHESYSEFVELNENIMKMFEDTYKSFYDGDVELAKEVIQMHGKNSQECENIISTMLKKNETSTKFESHEQVIAVLAARYFKRTSAHLKNIATSVVNPYDRIGYVAGIEDI